MVPIPFATAHAIDEISNKEADNCAKDSTKKSSHPIWQVLIIPPWYMTMIS